MGGVFAIKLPGGLEIRGDLAIFQIGAEHLDGHRALVEDGVVKLAIAHLMRVDELASVVVTKVSRSSSSSSGGGSCAAAAVLRVRPASAIPAAIRAPPFITCRRLESFDSIFTYSFRRALCRLRLHHM